jgi:hypothetical protein
MKNHPPLSKPREVVGAESGITLRSPAGRAHPGDKFEAFLREVKKMEVTAIQARGINSLTSNKALIFLWNLSEKILFAFQGLMTP